MSVELTDEQRAAVEARGQVFLSAGAGSGKTRVLVERFARGRRARRRPGRARGRHVHREGGARARRAHPRAAGGTSSAPATRRDRRAHLDDPRLLQPPAAPARRWPPARAGLPRARRGRGAASLASEAFGRALRAYADEERADALELLAAYGADRLRAMLATLHAAPARRRPAAGGDVRRPAPISTPRGSTPREEAQRALDVLDREPNRQRAETLAERCARISDPAFLVDLRDVKLLRAPAGARGLRAGARRARRARPSARWRSRSGSGWSRCSVRFDAAYRAAKASERRARLRRPAAARPGDLLTRDEAVRGPGRRSGFARAAGRRVPGHERPPGRAARPRLGGARDASSSATSASPSTASATPTWASSCGRREEARTAGRAARQLPRAARGARGRQRPLRDRPSARATARSRRPAASTARGFEHARRAVHRRARALRRRRGPGARPRRRSWPAACAPRSTPTATSRATSSCCCARARTSASTRTRWPPRACPRRRRSGAATGGASRCSTCSPTCA